VVKYALILAQARIMRVLHEPMHVNERVVLAILTSAIRATVRFVKRISAEKPTFF